MKVLGILGTIAQPARRSLRTSVRGSVQGVGGSRTTRIVTAVPNAYYTRFNLNTAGPGARRLRHADASQAGPKTEAGARLPAPNRQPPETRTRLSSNPLRFPAFGPAAKAAGRRDVSESPRQEAGGSTQAGFPPEIPEKPRIHTGPADLIRSNRRRSGHRTKLRNVNL